MAVKGISDAAWTDFGEAFLQITKFYASANSESIPFKEKSTHFLLIFSIKISKDHQRRHRKQEKRQQKTLRNIRFDA